MMNNLASYTQEVVTIKSRGGKIFHWIITIVITKIFKADIYISFYIDS